MSLWSLFRCLLFVSKMCIKIFYIQNSFSKVILLFLTFFSLSIKTKNTYPETARNCIIISFACRGSLVSRVMSYRISSSGLIINGGLPSRSSIFGNSTVCRIECATRLSATTLMEGWKSKFQNLPYLRLPSSKSLVRVSKAYPTKTATVAALMYLLVLKGLWATTMFLIIAWICNLQSTLIQFVLEIHFFWCNYCVLTNC